MEGVLIRDLTPHQKRVLAAMLALERRYEHRWWSRDTIGQVVDAGGYHQTIQRSTMERLYEAGLVMLEAESWSEEVQELVRCNCSCHNFGLTDAGKAAAESLLIKLTPANQRAIRLAEYETIHWLKRSLEDDSDEDEE